MKLKSTWLLLAFLCVTLAQAQLQSPEAFLGYQLGERFTPHHRIVDYFRHIAAQVPASRYSLMQYGTSYEGRPLLLAFVSSEANMKRLEEIRLNNLRLTGLEQGTGSVDMPAIVWLSYNVHGNESVSSEAVMATVYELLNPSQSEVAKWLEDVVVIIDPCLNPDGRDRYVNWYMQMTGRLPNANELAREHSEPWPGGRFNHYYYDLNRDWAWQSQQETKARIAAYQRWMPHVHVDFHEMGVNQPYYFAPASEPYHKEITPWQREFQIKVGRNNARYFDKNAWLYFTRETFDLLYPSYGDTWPTYNGAIGMTYEQGGSGRAGLAIVTETGDTLTLADRIAHHHWAGLSTIEASAMNRRQLMSEFKDYFERSRNNPSGTYKSFIISADNDLGKLAELRAYLDRNQIQYGSPSAALPRLRGFNYHNGQDENISLSSGDIVISTAQPRSVLVKVLFNPRTILADSVTYDATAWSLPYSMGLKAYAVAERIAIQAYKVPQTTAAELPQTPYAYLATWKNMNDLRFLSALIQQGIKVRYASEVFSLGGRSYDRGTLIIARTDNMQRSDFDKKVRDLALQHQVSLSASVTGLVSSGADIGSESVRFIQPPRVALLSGDGVSPTAFGELWHFLDEQMDYPVTVIQASVLNRADLSQFNVITMPAGNYRDLDLANLRTWVRSGGKLIVSDYALSVFANSNDFALQTVQPADKQADKEKPKPETLLRKYANRERDYLTEAVEGSIFEVELDATHPLAFGYGDKYYTLKRSGEAYSFLSSGWNVGVIRENAYVDGFAGYKVRQRLKNTLVFGVEPIGRGSVVYLVDGPVFRSSWHNGRLLMGNAIFFTGQ